MIGEHYTIDILNCLLAAGRRRLLTVRENKEPKRSEQIQAPSAIVATRHNADSSAHHQQPPNKKQEEGSAAMSAFRHNNTASGFFINR